jgi:hypothetical protein
MGDKDVEKRLAQLEKRGKEIDKGLAKAAKADKKAAKAAKAEKPAKVEEPTPTDPKPARRTKAPGEVNPADM